MNDVNAKCVPYYCQLHWWKIKSESGNERWLTLCIFIRHKKCDVEIKLTEFINSGRLILVLDSAHVNFKLTYTVQFGLKWKKWLARLRRCLV